MLSHFFALMCFFPYKEVWFVQKLSVSKNSYSVTQFSVDFWRGMRNGKTAFSLICGRRISNRLGNKSFYTLNEMFGLKYRVWIGTFVLSENIKSFLSNMFKQNCRRIAQTQQKLLQNKHR